MEVVEAEIIISSTGLSELSARAANRQCLPKLKRSVLKNKLLFVGTVVFRSASQIVGGTSILAQDAQPL